MAKAPESDAVQLMRSGPVRITMLAVTCAAITFIAVFAGLAVLVWRINANMDDAEATFRPHAQQIVNATVDMMHDLGGSFHNMHEISEYTNGLAASAGGAGGSAASALNSSAAIAAKLAEFMQHPTISLSLGGG